MNISRPDQFQGRHIETSCFDFDSFLLMTLVDHLLFNHNQGRGAKKLCLFLLGLEVQVQTNFLVDTDHCIFLFSTNVFCHFNVVNQSKV